MSRSCYDTFRTLKLTYSSVQLKENKRCHLLAVAPASSSITQVKEPILWHGRDRTGQSHSTFLNTSKTNSMKMTPSARQTSSQFLLDLKPITTEQLRLVLLKGKATAPGTIKLSSPYSVSWLKALATPYSYYNHSYEEGIPPTAWIIRTVSSIPKSNSHGCRPISLTSCLRKILESIIVARLLSSSPLVSPLLYCFLPSPSTHQGFVELLSHLFLGSCIAFIVKAAFDIAHRNVIQDEISYCGVKGWFYT